MMIEKDVHGIQTDRKTDRKTDRETEKQRDRDMYQQILA